jgi:hypothetical protein
MIEWGGACSSSERKGKCNNATSTCNAETDQGSDDGEPSWRKVFFLGLKAGFYANGT